MALAPREFAWRTFQAAVRAGAEVHCAVCDGRLTSIEDAYFLYLDHPERGELVAMACSDICLRRALAHGIP